MLTNGHNQQQFSSLGRKNNRFVGKTIVHKNVLLTDTQPKGTKKNRIKQTVLNNIFIQCGKGLQQNQYY